MLLVPIAGCASGESFEEVFPGIRWDRRRQAIAVDGGLCLRQGILEYVAVAAGGKEYESLFRLYCRPAHLQQALLMAGYEPGKVGADALGDYAPDARPAADRRPSGAPPPAEPPEGYWQKTAAKPTAVAIDVEFQGADGTWERRPIEDLLVNRRVGGPPARLRWVFTGSFFYESEAGAAGLFAADGTRSVIGLWYDPSCLLNLAEDVGNPYRGATDGLEVAAEMLPPPDTPARLVLRPTDGR